MAFFRMGDRIASLRFSGMTQLDNDKLTILVMTGKRVPKQSFKSPVGMGSKLHDFEADCLIILLTSLSIACSNSERVDVHGSCTWIWSGILPNFIDI